MLLMVILSFLVSDASCQKFLVLNDIHFSPNLTEKLTCTWGHCNDMGMKG